MSPAGWITIGYLWGAASVVLSLWLGKVLAERGKDSYPASEEDELTAEARSLADVVDLSMYRRGRGGAS